MPIELGNRDRVIRTIEHRDIDRIPLFHRANSNLNDYIKKTYNFKNDNDILSFYGSDAITTYVVKNNKYYTEADKDGIYTDPFGNKIKIIQNGDQAVIEPILADITEVDEIEKVKWPDKDFIDIEANIKAAEAARSTGLAVYGGIWASLFTFARTIMGEENLLVNMLINPEVVEKLVERLTDFYIEMNDIYFNACSKYIDIFYFGSDFGTQTSMFISRDMFCRFFKPHIKKLSDHAKNFGLKVMYHTCGSISSIIPDLIECGIDILDPVQVSCEGMDPVVLGEKFKNNIAFHGGISSQKTLPFGSAEEVRDEVINAIKAFGPLGYIASPDQDMIGDIPLENIDIMFKTIREYKL